jgi:PAS domain S-box-containing protein
MKLHSPLMTYGLSLAATAVAVLLRWLLDPVMGDTLPLVTLYGAVALAAWIGGFGEALVAAVLGYLACAYLFAEPRGSLGLSEPRNVVGLCAYLLTCAIIIAFGKMARASQRRAEVRREALRTTLASIGDAVIATDTAGRITIMNAAAELLTGWTSAEAAGQPLAGVFHIVNEQTRQIQENPVERVLQLGRVQGLANSTILISRDGTERSIDDSAAPIRCAEGEIVGCVMVFRDVTERRHSEEVRARLSAIVESSDDAIVSKDLNGIIMTWNAGAERLFGYAAAEAVGQPITMLIPLEHQDEEQEILKRLRRGQRIKNYETIRRRKDGRLVDISLTISPIVDSGGRIVGASKIAHDITDRKRAEAALKEADRRKDEFLAILAHELRNPLAPISNALQVLRQWDRDGAAVASSLEMLDRQVGQMSRLVDDLLDISRITRGRIELRKEHIDLGPVLEQAVAAVRPLAQSMRHEVAMTVPPEAIHLDADPIRLTQIVSNLLNNACKFMDKGGRILLSAEREDRWVVIRVRDTGIGITAEQLPRIFGMFIQVDTSLERSVGGLGIGLTLVQSLVQLHGGTVEARSDGLGHGSEFVVRLPILAEAPRPAPAPSTVETRPAERHRVLIVDDNLDSALSLAMLLKLDGHQTETVHDGVEAVEAADRLRPDVVLLDIGLPRLNGYEVCRHIRRQPWGKDVLLIALTGWGQEEDRQKSRETGFDTHIVKPVDHDLLTKLLASPPPARRSGG